MRRPPAVLLAAALALSAGSCLTEENEFLSVIFNFSDCKLTANVEIRATTNQYPPITGCRVSFLRAAGYDSWSIQLAPPGTTGSFFEPGKGWITITTTRDGSIVGSYVDQTGEKSLWTGSQGSIQLGNLDPNEYTGDNPGPIAISGALTNLPIRLAGVAGTLNGNFNLQASAASAGGQDEPGGTQFPAACQTYVNQCNAGGIAPCYCAAACACKAANNSCEGQNRAQAQQLGMTCSY